jgi:sigma-B regulation protein RsbU (phosphoserine phosphatase)
MFKERVSENADSQGIPNALMRRALSTTAEGITISDPSLPDNPLIYVNKGFEELTGYRAREVLGKNCRFLQGDQTNPAAAQEVRAAVREQRPCVVELLNYRKDGTAFWNRLSITPVKNSAGDVTHFIGVQSDITNRKEAEEALSVAKDQLQKTNEEMRLALESAAAVQMALLPHGFQGDNGIRIAWRLEACATLAGDILNAFWLDETHLGCYILDVMRHGVPAALLSVTLSHFLSPRSRGPFLLGTESGQEGPAEILSPAGVGERLNQRFPLDLGPSQFFTILYGILNTETKVFTYFSAGHPPMIHVPRGDNLVVLPTAGFPVGVVDKPEYEDQTIQLQSGDRLFIYSDGVTEVLNQKGEQFGIDRLCDAVRAIVAMPLDEGLTEILGRVDSWSVGAALHDDVSLLALEVE